MRTDCVACRERAAEYRLPELGARHSPHILCGRCLQAYCTQPALGIAVSISVEPWPPSETAGDTDDSSAAKTASMNGFYLST